MKNVVMKIALDNWEDTRVDLLSLVVFSLKKRKTKRFTLRPVELRDSCWIRQQRRRSAICKIREQLRTPRHQR